MVVAFFSHFRKLLLWVRENYDSRKTRLNSKSLVGNTKKLQSYFKTTCAIFSTLMGGFHIFQKYMSQELHQHVLRFLIVLLQISVSWRLWLTEACVISSASWKMFYSHMHSHIFGQTQPNIFLKKLNSGCTRINKLTQSHSKKCTVLLVVCAAFWAFSKGRVPL